MFDILARIPALFRRGRRSRRDPRRIFSSFRRVLEQGNLVMEIIADLEEKLGGDYIFDRCYIDGRVDELVEAMTGAVAALNELDPGHVGLGPVLDRLTAHLRAVLRREDDRQGPLTLDLAAIPPRLHGVVGGKNAHLAELARHLDDLPIPPGFVITTRAYHDLLDHAGLRPLVERFESLWPGEGADGPALESLRSRLAAAIAGAGPPAGLMEELSARLGALGAEAAGDFSLAVRSSAREEDLDFSFAGQFLSLLNVPPDPETVFAAYRRVAASLFSPGAVDYRRGLFPGDGRMSISVACQVMVDSEVSGIAYSVDPGDPGGDTMIVVAVWGQGAGIADGGGPGDTFILGRDGGPRVLARHPVAKDTAMRPARGGGLERRPVDPSLRLVPCLDDGRLVEIGRAALRLENYFKRPQDVEWTYDREGRLFVLQSRPLLAPAARAAPAGRTGGEVLVADAGRVAQHGIGAGPVRLVREAADLDGFPDGAVLVARRDSSRYAGIMPRAAAIVTEIGSPVSHMATLCREMRVPCLVGVPGITGMVEDGMEITVDAEDRCIFRGRVGELLAYRLSTSVSLEATREFRLLRRLLDSLTPMRLADPLMDDFVPENCQSYRDLLRYVHENAVMTLVELGKDDSFLLRGAARRLDLPVPAGIMVLDIGGGLAPGAAAGRIGPDAVVSRPLSAILDGMLRPGVWHREAMPVGFRDLMNSMLSAPADVLDGQYTGHNIAIVGRDYVNLCFRFGYHFNIVDARCASRARDNHIFFRFLGGATDLVKRGRRSRLIARILEAFDFNVRTRDDLVIARAGNIPESETERLLDVLGRLIGFTRQLDVRLDSEAAVDYYADAFMRGRYHLVSGRPIQETDGDE